jgi:putative glycosyltransferase (TIGR04372 family)
MAEGSEKIHDLRSADPDEMRRLFSQENLQHLANAVSPHLVAGERTLTYVLSMPGRIGHLALEPHAFFNLYADQYDRLVIVSHDNPTFPQSKGLEGLVSAYVPFAKTDRLKVVQMGHHDGNIQDFGIFSFAIAAPQTLLARFVEAQAAGVRPRFFEVPPAMRERGDEALGRFGIGSEDKIVGFHARTAGTHAAAAYHDYRNVSLANYVPLLNHLLERGFWVIRLGDASSPDMPIRHPRLVDLPKTEGYRDFMDVAVADRATFGLVGDSGPEAIFRILGKPILRTNCAATHHVWLKPEDLLLLKTYRDGRTGRVLGYREILDRGLSRVITSRDLTRLGVEVVENTPDELLAAGIEMLERLEGRGPDDVEAQERFLRIGAAFAERFRKLPPERRLAGAPLVTCYGYALPWTRHAYSYIDAHPGFLDG